MKTQTITQKMIQRSKGIFVALVLPALVGFSGSMKAQVTLLAAGTNITCHGSCNGSAMIIASGGLSPYTFSWNDGSTTSHIVSLCPGTYSVTVKDANNIKKDTVVVITEPSAITYTKSTNPATCGSNNGSASIIPGGGVPPYSYSWSNGEMTANPNDLIAGTYTVTIIDANNCTTTATAQINNAASPLIAVTSTTQSTCGNSDGSAIVSATGGTPPYKYDWSNNPNETTANTASSLAAGLYYVVVVDASHCTKSTDFFTVNNSNGPAITVASSNALCNGGTGLATVAASGGSSPYTYKWSNGTTESIVPSSLRAGYYTVTVTDNNNCSNLSTVIITSPPLLSVSAIQQNAATSGNNDGVAFASASGGTGTFKYSWNNGSTGQTASALATGTYTVTATDLNGCTQSAVAIITNSNGPLTLINSSKNVSCRGNCDGVAVVIAGGGTVPYSYSWSNNTSGTSAGSLCAGTYTVVVTDAVNATASTIIIITEPATNCVWPGDANNDLVADNNDLLQIGLGYGNTGTTRSNASAAWAGQASTDWTSLISSINSKYADCNGDGVVDAHDTTAIILNYGLTHNKAGWINNASVSDPTMSINFVKDSMLAGTAVSVPVMLGTALIPANNVYGVAFTVNIDTTVVKAGTMSMTYSSSWLGTSGTNVISIGKELYTNNRFDAAVTRIDHQNISGQGQIGTLNFVMKDDVSGKNYFYKKLKMGFTKVHMIDNKGTSLNVNTEPDSVIISQVLTGINNKQGNNNDIKVFPNPASEAVTVFISGDNHTGNEVQLINHLGQVVYTTTTDGSAKMNLDVKNFENGIYFIKIISADKVMMKTVSVMH